MPTCYPLTFGLCVARFVFTTFSVFNLKLCMMNTALHFLLYQSCRSRRKVSLGLLHISFLGLMKRSYHSWLSMITSSKGPFSALPRAFPALSPSLIMSVLIKQGWATF